MTFDELGIPFPLFAADVSTVDDYAGRGTCSLCNTADQHVFTLDYDGGLALRCPACAVDRVVRHPDDDDDEPACDACGTSFDLPDAPILVCYRCFRDGRAVFPRHTTEGFVDLDAIRLGHAGARQGFASEQFATVEVDLRTGAARQPPATPYPEHERKVRHFAARIPIDQMTELLRTPMFVGEAAWPFHCARPMIFLGSWDPDDELPDEVAPLLAPIFDEDDGLFVHVWRCPSCEALTWAGER
jgi:hypothetical protein